MESYMDTLSRRAFIGVALGAGSAMMAPGLALSKETGQQSKKSQTTESALQTLKDQIAAWHQEGRQFASDQLEADNNAQWNRLLDHYFERKELTCISVNSANLCPSLKPVDQTVELVMELLRRDISFPWRGELAEASLGYGLAAVKNWFGLDKDPAKADTLLALVANSTEGNNFINNGLVTSGFFNPQQDSVLAWDVNHPTNLDAWYYRRATQGWGEQSVRTLQTKMFSQTVSEEERKQGVIPSDPQHEDDIILPLLHLVDGNTKVVTLSWQSNECGMLLPMKRIVEELRKIKKNIHIHADSAQTFGVLDLQLGDVDVDSITGSFHKWPCGPKMVGIIYMNARSKAAERFTPSIWGYDEHINTPADYGYNPEKGQMDPNAKRFSYLGQQNDATLVSTWTTALFHTGHFHPNVSPAAIEARTQYLGTQVKEALFKHLPKIYPKFTEKTAYKWITTPTTRDDFRSSVFLFKPPKGISAGDVMKNVYEQYKFGIANLKVKGHDLVRISPTFCNSTQDVNDVVEATVEVIQAMGQNKLANNTHLRTYA